MYITYLLQNMQAVIKYLIHKELPFIRRNGKFILRNVCSAQYARKHDF